MHQINEPYFSILLKVPIVAGMGEWAFPYQLKNNLFSNFIRVRGLKSQTALAEECFVISNASEHGIRQHIIKNILGVFEFKKPRTYQSNPQLVTGPCNKIPEDIKITIVNTSFEKISSFNGYVYLEILGHKKNITE